ncbi:MAG: hypothetical protein ABR507_10630 [Actinomycetota bacterium]|nr:hypothetical protein [Actinomycetota bacterium]
MDNERSTVVFARKGCLALLLLALGSGLGACGKAVPLPAATPTSAVLQVTGHITEIEFGNLSLRALDQRQLIFSLQNSPVSLDHLQQRMQMLQPIHITYTVESERLIPITIEDVQEPAPPSSTPPASTP